MSHIPDSCWIVWRDLTMLVTKVLGTLLGVAMTSKADVLTVNGFAMRIIRQCTAFDYVAILSTAMLLYPRHSLSYRLLGLAVTVPTILVANACRLVISGVIGTFSRSAFDFSHDYLWVIGFALIVFAIWTLWVNGCFSISRATAWRMSQIAFASLATYALLFLIHDTYGELMANASSFFYRLLNDDPLATIIRVDDIMVYSHAGVRIKLGNLLEHVNVAIYVGLMVPLQKKGDWEMLGMTFFGLLCIVLMSAIFVALGCGFAVTSGTEGLMEFWCIGSVVHLALPMAVYWIMASERERGKLTPVQATTSIIRRKGNRNTKSRRQKGEDLPIV